MQIHRAVFRCIQNVIRKDLPVCDDRDDISLESLQLRNHIRVPEGVRLKNGNSVRCRTFFYRRKTGLHSPAARLVRLGINRADLKPVPDQALKRSLRKIRSAHKDHSHISQSSAVSCWPP